MVVANELTRVENNSGDITDFGTSQIPPSRESEVTHREGRKQLKSEQKGEEKGGVEEKMVYI